MTVSIEEAYCSICGQGGPFQPFFPGASLRETRCPCCGSSRRNRDVARVLLAECEERISAASARTVLADCIEDLSGLHIYELQAKGVLHDLLCRLPGYVCSEYLAGIEPGFRDGKGTLCQNVECLTFPDASFDIVVSQDVMEHVANPWRGFAEVRRVLKPGGAHICTVPLHEGMATRARARITDSGLTEYLLPLVFHKDPLDPEGALVFTDYGDDICDLLGAQGIPARMALHAVFYEQKELCRVDDAAEAECCRQACSRGGHVGYFLYNSTVLVCKA